MNKKTEKIVKKFIDELEAEKWLYEKGYEDTAKYFKNMTRHINTYRNFIVGKMYYDEITIEEFKWLWEKGIEIDTEYHTF